MTYLLDTNAWIAYLRQRDAGLLRRMQQANPADLHLCTIVLAELYYGAHHSAPQHQAQATPHDHASKLSAALRRAGLPAG